MIVSCCTYSGKKSSAMEADSSSMNSRLGCTVPVELDIGSVAKLTGAAGRFCGAASCSRMAAMTRRVSRVLTRGEPETEKEFVCAVMIVSGL